MMNKNIRNWEEIYKDGKAGSFLSYPNENLVTLFFQNKTIINSNGKCLDYGFGSANNTEFLIQYMHEMHGIEVSESSVDIAKRRLEKVDNFQPNNFVVLGKEQNFKEFFDLIVAWQMLYYNDKAGVKTSITRLHSYLKPGGIILCTLVTPRDVKIRHAKLVEEDTYLIDDRIPQQEGCKVFAPKDEHDFLQLFDKFEVIDYGFYERASFKSGYTASEYYLVARKN